MPDYDYEETLTRIAVALERQVAQADEQMALSRQFRDENVQRHERERDEELQQVRATNEDLLAKIATVIETNQQILALWQSFSRTPAQASSERL